MAQYATGPPSYMSEQHEQNTPMKQERRQTEDITIEQAAGPCGPTEGPENHTDYGNSEKQSKTDIWVGTPEKFSHFSRSHFMPLLFNW